MGIFDSLFGRALHAPAERGGGSTPKEKKGGAAPDQRLANAGGVPPSARDAGAPPHKARAHKRGGPRQRTAKEGSGAAAKVSADGVDVVAPGTEMVVVPEMGREAPSVATPGVPIIGDRFTTLEADHGLDTAVEDGTTSSDVDELASLFSEIEQEAEEAASAIVTNDDVKRMAAKRQKVSDWLTRVEKGGKDLYTKDQEGIASIDKREGSLSEGVEDTLVASKRVEIQKLENLILEGRKKVVTYADLIEKAVNSESADMLRSTLQKFEEAIQQAEAKITNKQKEIVEITGAEISRLQTERLMIEEKIQRGMKARMDRYRAILDAIDKDPSFIQFTADLKQKEDERRKEEEKLAQVARDNNDKARRELDATIRNERRQELARELDGIDRTATNIEKACGDAMKRLDNILVKLSKEEGAQGEIILLRKAFSDYQEKASDTTEQKRLILSLQKRIGDAVQKGALGFKEIQQIVPWLQDSKFLVQFNRLDSPNASQIIKQAKKQAELIASPEESTGTERTGNGIRGVEKLRELTVSNQSDSVEYTAEEKKAISALFDHADKVGNHRGLAIQLKQFLARVLPITKEQNRHGSPVLVGELAEYIKKVQVKQASGGSATVVKNPQKPLRAAPGSPLPPAPGAAVGVKESGPISPAPQQPAAGSSGPDRSRGGNQPNKGGSGGRKGGGGSQGGSKGGGRRGGGGGTELGQGDKFDKRTVTGGARGGETGRSVERHRPNEVYIKGSNLAVNLFTRESNGRSIGGNIEFRLGLLQDPESKKRVLCIEVVNAHGFDNTSLEKWFGKKGKGTERLHNGRNVIPLRSLEINPVKLTVITDYIREAWIRSRQPKASGGTVAEQADVGFVDSDREQDPDRVITHPELRPINVAQLPDQPAVVPEVREGTPLTDNAWLDNAGDLVEEDTVIPVVEGAPVPPKKPRKVK